MHFWELLFRMKRSQRYYFLNMLWARVITQLLYRPMFGTIGKGCAIKSPILLLNTECMSIGDNVVFMDGARLEAVMSRAGQQFTPRVTIGSGSTFEQNFHLACASEIVIGSNVAITQNVGVFDIWHSYVDVNIPIVDQPLVTAPVKIGDGTLVGMGAVIQPGVDIGPQCVIGANSVVTKSIPGYSVAVGSPARVIRRFESASKTWKNHDADLHKTH